MDLLTTEMFEVCDLYTREFLKFIYHYECYIGSDLPSYVSFLFFIRSTTCSKGSWLQKLYPRKFLEMRYETFLKKGEKCLLQEAMETFFCAMQFSVFNYDWSFQNVSDNDGDVEEEEEYHLM